MKYSVYVDYTTEEQPRPFYVGKGTKQRLKIISRNELHSRITEKYGIDRRVVFESDDEKEALDREIALIAEHDTFVYGGGWGANFTRGGDGTSGTKFLNRKGENHPMWGRKHTEESKRKNSETNKIAQAGELNGMFGRHHSEEARKKIGEKSRGRKGSDETRRRKSESLKGRNLGCKLSDEHKQRISASRRGQAPSNKVVGTIRLAGGCGPAYEVIATRCGTVEISFLESGEKAFLPIAAVRQDPLA